MEYFESKEDVEVEPDVESTNEGSEHAVPVASIMFVGWCASAAHAALIHMAWLQTRAQMTKTVALHAKAADMPYAWRN
jgi:hypothetical protein